MPHAFICYDETRSELASLLAEYLQDRGQSAILVSRDVVKRTGNRSPITEGVQQSEATYVIAEPDDVERDPLVAFTIGVANACDRPVRIVSLSDAIQWPVDIINDLVKVIGFPEKIAAKAQATHKHATKLAAVG